MKIDLICNTCGYTTKGDPEDIGNECPKCDTGSLIDASSEGEGGAKAEKPKGTGDSQDKKITKEEEGLREASVKAIELVQEEDVHEFNKHFEGVLKENIRNKIVEKRKEILSTFSDVQPVVDEMASTGDMGVLDDGSEFSVVSASENEITLLVGGKEMMMSTKEFESRAKVNSRA